MQMVSISYLIKIFRVIIRTCLILYEAIMSIELERFIAECKV